VDVQARQRVFRSVPQPGDSLGGFGTDFTARLRKRRPRPADTWHPDEMYLKINGELFYLWRVVDQHGVVLDIVV
jgi:transposase-like protein